MFFPTTIFVHNFNHDIHLVKAEVVNILISSIIGLTFQTFLNGLIFYYSFYETELDIIQCLLLGLIVGMPGLG